ncbi:MAG: hypothetical protein IJH36_00360 [Clostridia bacterium]|nr:hypothetical protein [Clostridia bacterium]MBQ3461559.1 hypothetical protein [Clostridia bacterium]
MTVSKAQQKAVSKYMKNNYDTTLIRFKKGSKSLIEAAAKAQNESINGYVKKAVKAKYEADTGKEIDL